MNRHAVGICYVGRFLFNVSWIALIMLGAVVLACADGVWP